MKNTLCCHGCKQSFRREDLISYASINSKTAYNYCHKCYKEKINRDYFSFEVCKIFGLKVPGARIWTERKRIQDQYGYTDNTIIDCLKYVYEFAGAKKLTNSLCLVTPANVEKMMKLKRAQEVRANNFNDAINNQYKKITVNIKKEETQSKNKINLNDIVTVKD